MNDGRKEVKTKKSYKKQINSIHRGYWLSFSVGSTTYRVQLSSVSVSVIVIVRKFEDLNTFDAYEWHCAIRPRSAYVEVIKMAYPTVYPPRSLAKKIPNAQFRKCLDRWMRLVEAGEAIDGTASVYWLAEEIVHDLGGNFNSWLDAIHAIRLEGNRPKIGEHTEMYRSERILMTEIDGSSHIRYRVYISPQKVKAQVVNYPLLNSNDVRYIWEWSASVKPYAWNAHVEEKSWTENWPETLSPAETYSQSIKGIANVALSEYIATWLARIMNGEIRDGTIDVFWLNREIVETLGSVFSFYPPGIYKI